MKSTLRTVAAALAGLLYSAATLAQTAPTVNNGTLETWEARNSGEAPQGWITTDDYIAYLVEEPSLPITSGTVTKSTDRHLGNFGALLETKNFAAAGATVPGEIYLGNRLNLYGGGELFGGVPYTARPTSVRFWYKATVAPTTAPTNRPAFVVQLLKTTGGKAEEVGYTGVYLPAAATYTLFDVPVDYSLTVAPDTMQMLFTSGYDQPFTAGNQLFVDDISLAGVVTATKNSATEAALQIYPNPSRGGEFSLASLGNAAVATAPFTVSDVTGREILRQAAASPADSRGRLVDLRGQRPGLYTLRLQTPDGPVVRKLVIE